ncbi:MAG: sialic acid TRAP transporter substrate-binding protein SiaP [Spirochaetota bacterium]
MKKRLVVLMMAVLLIAVILPVQAQSKFKIRFSSVSVPNDAHTNAMYTFKEELEKSSNGQISVEVYHSGQLFTQEAQNPALIRGTLEMAYTDPNWIAEYYPSMSMFTAGYVFKSYDHMTKVFNGDIGKKLFDDIAKKVGIRLLGAFYLGTRELNLRDIGRIVKRPEDLKGVKLRMPNSPTWLFLGKAMGANPTPLSFTELYLALKTGTVDGQDNPLPTDKNAKFYEVTKYIILTDHYVNPLFPTINEALWQKLGVDLQQKVYAAVEKARAVCDTTNLNAEKELVDFFKSQGLTIIEPDKEAFITQVQKTYLDDKEMTKTWDMELFNKVKSMAR